MFLLLGMVEFFTAYSKFPKTSFVACDDDGNGRHRISSARPAQQRVIRLA
jgi:hypothetical protein